jgi:hypothetical protein
MGQMRVNRKREVFLLVVVDLAIRKYPHPVIRNVNGLENEEIYL